MTSLLFSSRSFSLIMTRFFSFPTPLLLLLSFHAQITFGLSEPTKRSHALADSINAIGQQYDHSFDSLRQEYATWQYHKQDLLENPYYFPLFAAPTFYDFPIKNRIGVLASRQEDSFTPEVISEVEEVLLDTYAFHPELIYYRQKEFAPSPLSPSPQQKSVETEKKALASPQIPPTQKEEFEDPDSFELFVRRPNFWKFRGNFSLQFMQYHVSDNWHKGGENHNSLLASLNFEANYDNKQKVTFNNKWEMKLGFQTSNSDTQHRYKTNTDLLRMTNKFGLRATKRWYYTLMLQSWTQFYPGHKTNDPKVHSDFMSPFESVFSIGMDYKYSRKNFEIIATISPIATNFKYVDRLHLAPRYGLEKEKHSKIDLGSTLTVNTKWNITKDIHWSSRLYYFSSYKRVQAEWENSFSLKVNKYLSSKLFLYPRFDDGAKRKKGVSYFQFNEYLSVGLDLSF